MIHIAIINTVMDGRRCKLPCVKLQISCTTAATRRAPFWRRSASSSNNKAVRQPQPLGAFGKGMPVCLKRPNTITSLFDGQINWIVMAYEPQNYHMIFKRCKVCNMIVNTMKVPKGSPDSEQ